MSMQSIDLLLILGEVDVHKLRFIRSEIMKRSQQIVCFRIRHRGFANPGCICAERENGSKFIFVKTPGIQPRWQQWQQLLK
jgi:hypothetical protein